MTILIQLTKNDLDVRLCFPVFYDPIWSIISYMTKLTLEVQGHVAFCCPADFNTNYAALRYIFRECGSDVIFQLRSKVCEVITIPCSLTFMENQIIHLLIAGPSRREPKDTDDFFFCLEYLQAALLSNESPDVLFPIVAMSAHFAA